MKLRREATGEILKRRKDIAANDDTNNAGSLPLYKE
jgi:hypothetical protein